MSIIQFPRPASGGATFAQVWSSRIRAFFGTILNMAGVAGAVRDCEINDELSGQSLRIKISPRFTMISLNGRDYYFDRITGEYDGTGCSICN